MENQATQSIDLTMDQIREWVKSVRWQTAKDGSHSYTLAKWKPEGATELK